MARVTFRTMPCVFVRIAGEPVTPGDPYAGRDDGGLLVRFLEWQFAVRVFPIVDAMVRPGAYEAGFTPEHAELVRAWLLEQGAEENPR